MTAESNLREYVETARQSAAYRNYERARDRVVAMMSGMDGADASAYWQEELAGFDYMLDASPLIVNKLREHCFHITGLKSYDYRKHHFHKAKPFANKLAVLRKEDSRDLFVPEAPDLGGFGHDIKGNLINIDTLKFYETLIVMDRMGLLEAKGPDGGRRAVVEIGGGWGGFAYQFRKVVPDSTYVIVDLPQTMLFSGTYLPTVFPDARCLFHGEVDDAELERTWRDYDFVFIPHYAFDKLNLTGLDLGFNMVSFQEMTSEQVEGYARRLAELKVPRLYSHNRDRSAHNSQLSSVPDLLARHYTLEEHEFLPVSYTSLALPAAHQPFRIPRTIRPRRFVAELAKEYMRVQKQNRSKKAALDYRHFLGKLP